MAEHTEHHIVPIKVYVAVFLALMVFTAITVAVASFPLENIWGPLNIIVALTVAVIKATLVILYFMHVRYSSRLTQVIIVAGIFWLIILLAFTLADYAARSGWPTQLGQ
ncbi:MAG: cytochrome C oxidase subunit IV family protein [Acidobacteriota bacterium]|nr:MAG: cytochrome C oxidase subunit IV family protein [Acidobacteriota bacterium]